jgi:hypothetical protein
MDHCWNEKRSIRGKSVPELICSLEISIGLSRNWTRAYKISGRRLRVWAIAIRQRMWATMHLYRRKNKVPNMGGIQESYGILKHAANISAIASRKHTKSYHIRRSDLIDTVRRWRPNLASLFLQWHAQKKHLMNYVNRHLDIAWFPAMSMTDTNRLRNLHYSYLCQFTRQTRCGY